MEHSIIGAILILTVLQSSALIFFAPPHEKMELDFASYEPPELKNQSVPPEETKVPPQTIVPPKNTAPPPPVTPGPPKVKAPPQQTPPPLVSLAWKYTTRGDVYGIGVSGDGEYTVASSSDGRVYLLNRTGDLLWKFRTEGSAKDVAITPDGSTIVAASYLVPEGKLYLLDNRGVNPWKRKVSKLSGVDITPDKGLIIGASKDGMIYTFNRLGGKKWEQKTEKSAFGVWDVAISFDGKYIVAGADDKNIYFLDASGNVLWKKSPSEKSYIYGVGISGGGEYVAAAAQDKKIYVFDREGNLKWSYQTGFSNYGVAVSIDGKHVALGSWDKNLYLFDIGGKLLWKTKLGGAVNRVAFSPDKKYLAAGSRDDSAYLFKLNLGT